MKKFPKTPPKHGRIESKDKFGNIKRVTFNPWGEVRKVHEKFLLSFGEVPELSIASRIIPHMQRGNIFFVKMDISDAYGSVRRERIEEVLPSNRTAWKGNEEMFFHPGGGVIQGSLSAPKIFEAFCNKTIDSHLRKFCSERGITYTRYVDDLIFSSNRSMPKILRKNFRRILRSHDLEPNPLKDKVVSTNKVPLRVLGLEIYKGRCGATEEFKESLKELQRYDWFYENQIKGRQAWIDYIDSMNPS